VPTWIWIVIAVVVVLAIALGTGTLLARRRRVSLKDATPPPKSVTEGPPAKGGYKAGGSISFSSGGGGSGTATAPRPTTPRPPATTGGVPTVTPPPVTKPFPVVPAEPTLPPLPERTEVDGQPAVGDDAAVPRDSPSRHIVDVALPETPAAPSTAPQDVVGQGVVGEIEVSETVLEAVVADGVIEEVVVETVSVDGVVVGEVILDEVVVTEPDSTQRPTGALPAADDRVADERVVEKPFIEPEVFTAPVFNPPVAPAAAPVTAPVPTVDEIAPTAGRLNRLRGRLARSQSVFGKSLLGLLGAGTLDEDSWTDVEDTLLLADLGAGAAAEITARLRAEVAAHGITDAASARALLRRVLIEAVGPGMDRSVRALPHDGRPSVLLIVGVNGTGKTTTTGKLARVLVGDGRHVVLGAADTFRAAAAEQLVTWGERSGAVVVRADAGTDPASVAFDAVKRGIADGADAVLIDTAGRLHTKTGLMDELGKVKRVVEKQAQVDEILLVLDATTGQNGLVQATVFADVVDITGIVLTKLDGTAKGGIVVAVQRTLNVPVKLVGLGEGPDDLAPFEPEAFVDALLGD
jgi:fused signal recognition particle receptor